MPVPSSGEQWSGPSQPAAIIVRMLANLANAAERRAIRHNAEFPGWAELGAWTCFAELRFIDIPGLSVPDLWLRRIK